MKTKSVLYIPNIQDTIQEREQIDLLFMCIHIHYLNQMRPENQQAWNCLTCLSGQYGRIFQHFQIMGEQRGAFFIEPEPLRAETQPSQLALLHSSLSLT